MEKTKPLHPLFSLWIAQDHSWIHNSWNKSDSVLLPTTTAHEKLCTPVAQTAPAVLPWQEQKGNTEFKSTLNVTLFARAPTRTGKKKRCMAGHNHTRSAEARLCFSQAHEAETLTFSNFSHFFLVLAQDKALSVLGLSPRRTWEHLVEIFI